MKTSHPIKATNTLNKAKKLKKMALVGTVTAAIMLSGCASTFDSIKQGYSSDISTHQYPKTDPDKVVLVFKDQPDQKLPCKDYETLGQISVEPYNVMGLPRSKVDIEKYLREGGAAYGANAVINIVNSSGMGQDVMGYAIRCHQK